LGPREQKEVAIWFKTQDLHQIYKTWRAEKLELNNSPQTMLKFSKAVRAFTKTEAVVDTRAKACLPICVKYWLTQANKYDFNEIEDFIDCLKFVGQSQCDSNLMKTNKKLIFNKQKGILKEQKKCNFNQQEQGIYNEDSKALSCFSNLSSKNQRNNPENLQSFLTYQNKKKKVKRSMDHKNKLNP
jgi:hypothetical protein